MPHDHCRSLTQSPLLARNTLWNLVGYGTPAAVALVAIPLILAAMGPARFGILSLAWVLIGYLSLLDLGLGRALTRVVAKKLGQGAVEEIPAMIWTALVVMMLLAVFMGTILALASGWMVEDLLKIPLDLRLEARSAFLLLAVFLPLVILGVGFRGILEAYQRFDMVNAVRIPLGILSFAAPLLVIPFSVKLPAVIAALIAVRLLATSIQFLFCCRIVKGLFSGFAVKTEMFGRLLRFGSWMTVTNVINPLLVYVDRFFIGALLSMTAVAFYATPSEATTYLALISAALMGVMFPAFSATFDVDRKRSAFLFERSLKYVFMVMFPVTFLIAAFSFEGLQLWLNEEFATNSFRVCQMLAFGVLFGCLGQMPYALIQGAGRPDLSGKLHLCQLPFYIVVMAGAIRLAGINGAALVWALRAAVDAACMYLLAQKLLGPNKVRTLPKLAWLGGAVGCMAVVALLPDFTTRIAGSAVVLMLFAWIAWRWLLSREEIVFVRQMLY